MRGCDPLLALGLPGGALVDRRVPRALLIENGAPTAADRRRIREGTEELRWLAVLKPTTVGVAEYRDGVREYLEIAVLKLALRSGARADRLAELVHRAVPYPVLLIAWQGGAPDLSLAHKRWSQAEAGKTVIDGDIVSARLGVGCVGALTTAFFNSLALTCQPRSSTLYTLYQGWVDAVQALQAARVTGVFSIPTSATEAAERAVALQEYRRLETRIAELRSAAGKERQIARQVEINLELERLRADCDSVRAKL